MNHFHVSFFKGYSDVEPTDISLEEAVKIIKNDTALKDRTEKHRYYLQQGLKRDAEREKSCCPCFSVAVRFEGGKTRKNVCAWTGYSLVDMDHIPAELMENILKRIEADEHTLLAYITASGAGIRILVRIEDLNGLEGDKAFRRYSQCFNDVNAYYSRLCKFQSDGQCKNATRLSGMAADANVYFNPDAQPLLRREATPTSRSEEEDAPSEAPKRNKRLEKAVKAAQQLLEEEGLTYSEHHHNEYVMRMGYLLNEYGVAQKTAAAWAVEQFPDYDGNVTAVMASCYEHVEEHGTRSFGRKHKNQEGTRFATVNDIEEFLTQQASFRKNVISGKTEVCIPDLTEGFAEMDDRCINTLWKRLSQQDKVVHFLDMRALIESEYTPLFNPFEDYFNSLESWDGVTDYIGGLIATVKVKSDQNFFAHCFRKWLVASVAALLDPEVVNHEILVFIGEQGRYKTTWMQNLLPPVLRSYFYLKSNSDRIIKDDVLTLTECAFVCLEELDEMSAAHMSQLKAIVSMKVVNERAFYGHFKERRPHVASFCGTSNHTTFLNDLSGSRRWLPFEIDTIENPYTHSIHYDGVYAQAYALWKGGFSYWFDDEENKLLKKHNRMFEVPCLERDLVQMYYRRPLPGEACIFVTNAQILGHISSGIHHPFNPTRLGQVMKQEGYECIRSGGCRGYRVVELKNDEIYRNQCALAHYT